MKEGQVKPDFANFVEPTILGKIPKHSTKINHRTTYLAMEIHLLVYNEGCHSFCWLYFVSFSFIEKIESFFVELILIFFQTS